MYDQQEKSSELQIDETMDDADTPTLDAQRPSIYAYFQLVVSLVGVLLFIAAWNYSNTPIQQRDSSDRTFVLFGILMWLVYPWVFLINIFSLLTGDKSNVIKSVRFWMLLIGTITIFLTTIGFWTSVNL